MSSIPHLDHEIISSLRDVMEDDFPLLIETFITDSQERIGNLHTLVTGAEADEIRRAAHSFKGSSSNIGAARLAELCKEVEMAALENKLADLPKSVMDIEAEFNAVIASLEAMKI